MRIIWKIISNIFKYSLHTVQITKTIITNTLFIIFIIIGIGIYLNTHNSIPLENNTALILDITGTIVDKPTTRNKIKNFSQYIIPNTNRHCVQENSLFDIINILRQAKNDPKITGLILSLKNFSGSNQASLEYIGKALTEFKNSGKIIYAISDYYNQPQYFLASYAHKIYLTPQGTVDLRGIATNKLYYKSLLNNLKINTHIFRVGKYKSAVEPFMRDNMSDEVRIEEQIWINKLWQQYLKTISTNRNTTTKKIFPDIKTTLNHLHQMQGDTAKYALHNKWIDEIASSLSIEEMMKKKFGNNTQNSTFNSISMYDYNPKIPRVTHNDNQIAIICINGSIIDGADTSHSIGGDTVTHKIRNARTDPNIKAIILRINSPGGSVNASELIRSELIATKKSGKPIIVSMGGVAASGGYWISTPADSIIASNSTLTGSIGIFGIINTFENSLDSIGIHSDGVYTAPLANISMNKSLPDEYIKIMQLYVNTNYNYFVKTVAESRQKSITDINKIAQGHIWTGCDAIKNGLIDSIGDFDDAICKAAELAKITEYQLNWNEDKINWLNILLQQTNKIVHLLMSELLKNYVTSFQHFNNYTSQINNSSDVFQFIWNDPKNCYALCLNSVQYK